MRNGIAAANWVTLSKNEIRGAQVLVREEQAQRFVEVAVPGVPQTLSYRVPAALEPVAPGDEVVVPIARGERSGWVLAVQEQPPDVSSERRCSSEQQIEIFKAAPEFLFKDIRKVIPAFLPAQLDLFRWMSEYYGVPLADVLQNALPKRYEAKEVLVAVLSDERLAREALPQLRRRAGIQAEVIERMLSELSSETADAGIPLSSLCAGLSSRRAAVKALEKKGLLLVSQRSADFAPQQLPADYVRSPEQLTNSQARVLEKLKQAIRSTEFQPHLLFGVTGSGKTEVYIQAIREALQQGGAALLLVPEISLTPQLVDQLSTRLDVPLALLHSQVGGSERWRYWEGIRSGAFRVVVGARSALFAPIPNLRLIVVDEEHETSYKQSDGLRYHARDVAVMRSKIEDCTLILGSATPSLESLLNVQRKRYKLLELPDRVHARPVPAIEIIDVLRIPKSRMPVPTISPQLQEALSETLQNGDQAVVLYNKRGFSSYLQCDSCGEAVCCSECSVALTYHKKREILLCHYCGRQEAPPEACGYCRNPETTVVDDPDAVELGTLSHRGAGTERVIEDLAELFPEAKLARMDRDTVGAKNAYRDILQRMRSGEADILVGTQMIAKGHDLPGVTLVGIVDADVGLHIPDFRTSERVFQLITQAAGRAGRGEKQGRVLIQTRQAQHPTIVATSTGRFLAFARFQLEQRQALQYPPFGRLLRVIVSAAQQRNAISYSEQLVRSLRAHEQLGLQILGPAPAPHQRLRGLYRWHLLIKASSASSISKAAHALHQMKRQHKDVRIAIDVDPVDML